MRGPRRRSATEAGGGPRPLSGFAHVTPRRALALFAALISVLAMGGFLGGPHAPVPSSASFTPQPLFPEAAPSSRARFESRAPIPGSIEPQHLQALPQAPPQPPQPSRAWTFAAACVEGPTSWFKGYMDSRWYFYKSYEILDKVGAGFRDVGLFVLDKWSERIATTVLTGALRLAR